MANPIRVDKFVVDSLSVVAPIVATVLVLCIVVRCFVSNTSFAIILMEKSELVDLLFFVFLVSRDCILCGHSSRCHGFVCSFSL